MMGSRDIGNMQIESRNRKAMSFVDLFLLLSDKTATTLQRTTLLTFPVRATLQNLSAFKRQSWIDIRRRLMGFFPQCCTQGQQEAKEATKDEEIPVYELISLMTVPL